MTLSLHDEIKRAALLRAWDLGLVASTEEWVPGAGFCDLVIWRDGSQRRPLAVIEFKECITNTAGLVKAMSQVRRYCRWYSRHGLGYPAAHIVAGDLAGRDRTVLSPQAPPVRVSGWGTFDLAQFKAAA